MNKLIPALVLTLILPTLVFGQVSSDSNSLDNQFSTPTNITDQKMNDAKDFVHKGIKDRVIEEKCSKINNCKEKEGFPLEMLIGKAYAVLGMISGSGGLPELNKPATKEQIGVAEEANKPTKPEQDKQKDYCMMMSMAYEAVGGMIQQSLQKKSDNTQGAGDAQLQALVSLQETHKARQKTAQYQSYVYGAVTACYTGLLVTKKVSADKSFILKISGAAALTGLFVAKAKKHKSAADKVGEVIAALDWAGKKCNPWTKTPCFCSELTSKKLYPAEYQEVCVLNHGNFETPKVALGCASVLENKIQYDKECKCKVNNSCAKSTLKAYNPSFGMGNNMMADANKIIDLLGSGEYDQGELDRASLRQAALASGIKFKTEIPTPVLNDEQKRMADELKKFMPENVALFASASPSSNRSLIKEPSFDSASIEQLSDPVKEKLAEVIDVNYKKGGTNLNSLGDDPEFTMPKIGKEEDKSQGGTEVIHFADKATAKAEVSQSSNAVIFDLISNRYRVSGWRKLERYED